MSERRAIYAAEMVLRSKLAQFGAITRHLLCTENLSDEGLKALMLLTEKCEDRNAGDCIFDFEFEKYGLSAHLTDWEMAGFTSAHQYAKAQQPDRPQIKDSDFLPKSQQKTDS